jgi:hypothetical protein
MSRVSIASVDKAPVMGLPPGFSGDVQTQGLFHRAVDPLHLYLHRLVCDARLRIGPGQVDCMLYVWKGAVEAGGRELAAGSSLIVEHGAALDIRGAHDDSMLLAFSPARAAARRLAGGHVHLLPNEYVPRVARLAGTQGVGGAMHANAECPTCEVWLHENSLDPVEMKPGDDTSEKGVHSHSEDEVIFVIEGQMLLGSRLCGPGTALAIAAETLYSFGVGPGGLTFINFRAARPSEIKFKSGYKVDEVAFWRDRVPAPEYLDPLPSKASR